MFYGSGNGAAVAASFFTYSIHAHRVCVYTILLYSTLLYSTLRYTINTHAYTFFCQCFESSIIPTSLKRENLYIYLLLVYYIIFLCSLSMKS